jgi:hypothetical protein
MLVGGIVLMFNDHELIGMIVTFFAAATFDAVNRRG